MTRALRVAFQGAEGAYSEGAVHRWFGPEALGVPHRTFLEVTSAVEAGTVEFGVLPIENSISGAVPGSRDLLTAAALDVLGEVVVPIHHLLLGVRGSSLDRIRRVHSHPVALAQCGRFLAVHPELRPVAAYDTAGAAAEVARLGDASVAAIAGQRAADRLGLVVLAAGLEDRPDNATRFAIIGRRAASVVRPVLTRGG